MSRALLCLIAVLAACASTNVAAQRAGAKQTTYALIRCESPGNREGYCAADTQRGVQLVRTLSGRCDLGRGWGYDRGGIWVRGCAGEFEIGRSGDGYGYGWGYQGSDVVVCESRDYRYQQCAAETRGGVRLINQVSKSPCTEGRTWGSDRQGIWVDQGCAGEFEIGGGGGYAGGRDRPGAYGYDAYGRPCSRDEDCTSVNIPVEVQDQQQAAIGKIVCESRDNRRRHCPARLDGYRMVLARTLSRQPCDEGDSWGYDASGVWVDHGCRGEFEAIEQGYGRGRPYDRGRDPGYGQGGGYSQGNETLVCESREYQRSFCEIGRARSVVLFRQVSKSQCLENQTWGYDGRSIWVDQGCKGEFQIRR
jgi:hypothetical protein